MDELLLGGRGRELAGTRRSLQDLIRDRQYDVFVGRKDQLFRYQTNLALRVDNSQRYFLFNIHGVAGVGKTYLTRQLRQIASELGALTGLSDEMDEDATAAMSSIAEQLRQSGAPLSEFEKRIAKYRETPS